MELESCVPPGFRFYPTEEELVGYYLARKVASHKIDLAVIADIDLYRMEPWDLQDRQKLGYEEQNEWYFFSHKDKKYPTGTRTNRATAAGFWKATGRDKAVLSKSRVIGMRKTLVFYVGRAPNGRKTDWIMHEYRLQSSEHESPQEEGWVVCRAFRKQTPNQKPCFNTINPSYYIRDHGPFGEEALADVTRTTRFMDSFLGSNLCEQQFGGEGELEAKQTHNLSTSSATKECLEHNTMANKEYGRQRNDCEGQFIDWKVLDKLLASQLSESATDSISNVPMIPLNCDTDAQDQDHFLASFHS